MQLDLHNCSPKAFPIGSCLTAQFSKAILAVTQGQNTTCIEQNNFGPGYSPQDPLSSTISQQTSSLTFYDFRGLFVIIGSVTLFVLFCSETSVGRKFISLTAQYGQKCFCFLSSKFHSTQNDDEEIHASVPDTGATSSEGGDAIVFGGNPSGSEEEIYDPGQNNEGAFAEDREVKTDSTEERNSMAHN
ncbi:Hypothetical predicted protein [Olea europaea subsp. europaea]|uniref:Uncharacterized protein n=1 Tax=Olea europaea subsp. europaea TaxID=158383 RepID=A0A8S0TF21_OLEEU|nr:Hypothetical predicted protein [Olea europaea subsp. europaea]